MPRKSGIKLLYELRRNRKWSQIPVLIVTGHAQDELGGRDLEQIMASRAISGPKSCLEKPVNPARFVNAVRRELGLAAEERTTPGDRRAQLRDRLAALIDEADERTLERIISGLEE